jgi:phytoene dehydrogenase-like protein
MSAHDSSGSPAGAARDVDAVVIGSGPNGLTAANLLADAGWSVLVLEAQPEPGGAVRSAELVEPGFVSDMFSAFYPLGIASPVLNSLRLEDHGLRWAHSPSVVANPDRDGRCAFVSRDIDETADSLDSYAPGDGDAWRRLVTLFRQVQDPLIDALLGPFPPVGAGARIAARLGPSDLLRFARFAVLPVRRMAEEEFSGKGGGLLLGGNALHSDLGPDSPISGFMGWLLCMLGQTVGFPAPVGGAGELTAALVRRLEARGGTLTCNSQVEEILVGNGRVRGVRLADGGEVLVRRAVVADVAAPSLYLRMLPRDEVPGRVLNDIRRFQFDNGTFKVDWTLNGPIPWTSPAAGGAGTIHLARDMDHLTDVAAQLSKQLIPSDPYLILGQMTTTDPTRSPEGTETVWAYSHVPQQVRGDAGNDDLTGAWDDRESEAYVRRMEDQIEQLAPGFRDRIRGRHVLTPKGLQDQNGNLIAGALGGGTTQLHQQLVFRPTPGLAGPRTFLRGLYLASSSTHPGGGVHGANGGNAAHAALQDGSALGTLRRVGADLGRALDRRMQERQRVN